MENEIDINASNVDLGFLSSLTLGKALLVHIPVLCPFARHSERECVMTNKGAWAANRRIYYLKYTSF